ncbi:MAG: DUF1684 domain-containing protein [Sphingobacteriales bacterium]|nr:DUF1684 domain-containing protein [Sphingobacteriales bacterium]
MLNIFRFPKVLLLGFFVFQFTSSFAQDKSYRQQLKDFRTDYIQHHEVVIGDSIKYLRFYPIRKSFEVKATFTPLVQPEDYKIPTSSGRAKAALKIGYLSFKLKGKTLKLGVYQLKSLMKTEKYHDYVFTPFTDQNSGIATYGGGRYLDFTLDEIQKPYFKIDFNKAYNPSCIYASGFSCPIPPEENDLPIKIKAGEKIYALYAKNHQD